MSRRPPSSTGRHTARGRHPFPRGRGAAGGGAGLGGAGASPRAELRLEEQARTHRLKVRPSGLCRRSPPAGDRWHRRQPVAAARVTAVLPRGSSGSHRSSPPAPTGGRGHGGRIGVRGVRRPRGWSPGTGGSGLAAGGAAQGRGRPPPATRRHLCPGPLRSRPERAWPFTYPARASAGPPRTSTRRAPSIRQGQARCARPFGTPDGGAVGRSGWSRARASCWLAGRAGEVVRWCCLLVWSSLLG